MSETIGSLFFNFGASTSKLDSAFARIEQQEMKLADLREANASKIEDINDKLSLKREQASIIQSKIAEAQSKKDVKLADKYKQQLEKLELQIKEIDNLRIRTTARAERAEAKLTKQIEKQRKEYSNLKASVEKVKQAMTGFVAVTGSAFSLKYFNDAIDKIDQLAKRSRDIGMTASQIQELQHQANLAGVNLGGLDASIKAFNRNISLASMGTGEAKTALAEMGILLQDANGKTKTQSELLKETANWFALNSENAKSAGYASRIFGESGVELLRIFEQGEETINKVFDANRIDSVASSAEAYKDALENINNLISTKLMVSAGKFADVILTAIGDLNYYETIAKRNLEIVDGLSAKSKNELAKIGAEIAKLEEKFKSTSKYISIGYGTPQKNPEFEAINKQLEDLKQRRREIVEQSAKEVLRNKENNKRIAETEALQERLKKQAEQKAFEEERVAEALFEEEKVLDRIREKELAEKKSQAEKLKSSIKSKQDEIARMNESRKEFELQTKIDVLKKQGRTKEAEALEFAQKRNKLMEKYGYSIEQATKAQKTLDALQKGGSIEYSEKMKKKAESILKRGKGGSVGDKTIAEAQAIVDGKKIDGGFKTSIFSDANKQNKEAFRNINVDAKTSKQQLDDEAKKLEKETANSTKSIDAEIKNLNKLIEEIKSAVQILATENSNKEQTK